MSFSEGSTKKADGKSPKKTATTLQGIYKCKTCGSKLNSEIQLKQVWIIKSKAQDLMLFQKFDCYKLNFTALRSADKF